MYCQRTNNFNASRGQIEYVYNLVARDILLYLLTPIYMGISKKLLSNEAEIVARVRGTATLYANQTIEFHPDGESEKSLYNATSAQTKSGAIKQSAKSAVMRVVTDAKSESLKADLMRKSLELIGKLPDDASEALVMPDYRELVGETNHGKVFLSKDQILVQIALRFDEPNPKVADLLAHASAEQLKFIKQYLDPTATFLAEVAALCLLLANCQAQHERDVKLMNPKPRKSKKK